MITLIVYCVNSASVNKAYDMVPKDQFSVTLENRTIMPYIVISLIKNCQQAFYSQKTGLTLQSINAESITIPNKWLDASAGMTII
jgi:hypothetical protein